MGQEKKIEATNLMHNIKINFQVLGLPRPSNPCFNKINNNPCMYETLTVGIQLKTSVQDIKRTLNKILYLKKNDQFWIVFYSFYKYLCITK